MSIREYARPSVGMVSLGCAKALVDSEQIITRLTAEGFVLAANYQGADLVIVNTCGFIDPATEESLQAIGEALTETGKVIVTGCLGRRQNFIRGHYPKVAEITGPHDADAVMAAVHKHLPRPDVESGAVIPDVGLKLTPPHYAYLKISEGCNHRCSFCIIPDLRGELSSRPIGEVLREAEGLAASGVREIMVIAQDSGAYGLDLRYRPEIVGDRVMRTHVQELARELGKLGVWVRLHYLYPYPHIDELISLMADGLILPYLDIPFQHASTRILKAMRRPANGANVLERISAWREKCPDLTIRSTFIVGFPGETEADFQQLLDFLSDAQLNRVGCFTYSPVEGAAANDLSGKVPPQVAERRRAQLMEVQAEISRDRLAGMVGERVIVLVDEVDGEGAVARSAGEAPEIDGSVIIEDGGGLDVGEFYDVTITGSDEHDLFATAAAPDDW